MVNPAVIAKARQLLSELNPRYPLNVSWLAAKIIGKKVEFHKLDFPMSICAVIIDKPHYRAAHIGVNRNRPRTSQRFGVAHETSHVYLRHKGEISITDEGEDPILHAEADACATEWLMPQQMVLALASRYREPLTLIQKMQRGFIVSVEAACRRVLELGICYGAFAMYNGDSVLFAYNSPGFFSIADKTKELPYLIEGFSMSWEDELEGLEINCHLKRYKSGNYLAALTVIEKPVAPYLYQENAYVCF